MSDTVQLLEAGGLVPVGAKVPAEIPTDTVDARVYTHPAIPGRAVVRLVPDAIARGADTEMGLLGFAMTGHHDDIALQRRRTLGFPGSALVADPERARFALDVMKEFRKQAKRIASKPGHARDGFEEIAERLSRQVPHFLPSYYEEVGRAFANAGNFPYAASSFDKARTSEQKYGLEVDEERRGEAFLEFALLGALTVKSLQAYGKELQKSVGGESAYERMFQLAIRRTLGGLPPWASLPKDLRSLIKGAKKKPDQEDQRFLREVLGASSLQRAPASFWNEYRDAVVALAKAEPASRARLLDLFPNGGKTRYSWRETDDGFEESWRELLWDAGAFEVLWDPGAPADAVPNGGRAAWFKRYQDWASAGDGWVLQLVRKAAPVLKAAGDPVVIATGDYYKALDLDLMDLLIELGVPWKTESQAYRLDLAKWAAYQPAEARHGFPADHRPRDPAYAAKDPHVLALLAPAVDAVFGNAPFEAIAAQLPALEALRRDWLDLQLADLTATGLAATSLALGRLESVTSPATFAEFPHATEALAPISAATALHRTLQTGLFDELGWPAYDEVATALGLAPDTEFHLNRQFPYLILGNNRKLYVMGPAGIELVHDLKLPKDQSVGRTAYVGGQLFVSWSQWANGKYTTTAYWSKAPADTFEVEQSHAANHATPWTTADAIVLGLARFEAGARTGPPVSLPQYHDADKSWVWDDGKLWEQDRQTGKKLTPGAPGFLQDMGSGGASEGAYLHLPPALAKTSLLPLVDGQYGAKYVRPAPKAQDHDEDEDQGPADAEIRFETLAGDRRVGTYRHGNANHLPSFLIRWPGGALRAVTEQQQWWRNAHNSHYYVADPERPQVALMTDGTLRMRHAWLPPAGFWHYLVPRDPKGSAALRKVDPAVAAELVAVARDDDSKDRAATVAAVKKLLPAITDPTLQQGVAVVARIAGEFENRLHTLREQRQGGTVTARPADDVDDATGAEVFGNLGRWYSYGGGSPTAEIRTLGAFLVRGETGANTLFSRLTPRDWAGRIRALGWCVSRPGLSAAQRAAVVKVLRSWVDSGLADDANLRFGTMRIDKLEKWIPTKLDDDETVPHTSWRYWEDQRRIVVWGCPEQAEGPWHVSFAEWVDDPKRFAEYPGAVVKTERRVNGEGDREWLEALCAAAEQGPRAVTPDQVAAFAEATGITPGEAGLALAVFPQELDKDVREAMGLKAAEVKAAATQLHFDTALKLDLLAAAAPADPAALWSDAAPGLLATAWLGRFGKAVPVATELVTQAEKEMWGGATRLKQIANPGSWSELSVDGNWEVSPNGRVVQVGSDKGEDDDDDESKPGAPFTGDTAAKAAEIIGWLAPKLAVGDPLGANLVSVYTKVLERLKNPTLLLACGQWYTGEAKDQKVADAWFDALGGELVVHKDDDDDDKVQSRQRKVGPLVATHGRWTYLACKPAGLDPTSRELVAAFAKASSSSLGELNAYDLLHGEDFAALVARVGRSPLAAGQWEQNAALSAPDVVAAVGKKHGLTADAALLYLQTLTLLDPSKKNVLQWNGWTAKAYLAAAAELAGKGLVLEGKRARAGREHFLPGGWLETKDILPYEEWKRPLYGWTGDAFPFSDPVALAPLHVLFARAWERSKADPPRFQEVRR